MRELSMSTPTDVSSFTSMGMGMTLEFCAFLVLYGKLVGWYLIWAVWLSEKGITFLKFACLGVTVSILSILTLGRVPFVVLEGSGSSL